MEVSERRVLTREASRLGVDLSDAELSRLAAYATLVGTWNERIRLIGDREPGSLVRKHLPDCLALSAEVPASGTLLDIGSGAGLPGMVVACVRPALSIWLIEPRRRRASFLDQAKATLGLERVTVVEARAEDLIAGQLPRDVDVITARAVAIDILLTASRILLGPRGRVLAMHSGAFTDERATLAGQSFGFDLETSKDYRLSGGEARRILAFRRGRVSRET